VSCFSGEFIIFEYYKAQETPKTRSTALSATKSLHIGLYVHICTCECAAGSPTTATTAAREHYCTKLLLLAGRGVHKTHKTRSRALSAGHPHHVGLYAHICTSKCAAGCPTPHVWLWSHGVLWQDRQASMCSGSTLPNLSAPPFRCLSSSCCAALSASCHVILCSRLCDNCVWSGRHTASTM